MSEKERRILETFGRLIPILSESNKSYLLGFGEGMAISVNQAKNEIHETSSISAT